MPKKEDPNETEEEGYDLEKLSTYIKLATTFIKEVGLVGFLLFVSLMLLWFKGTPEQHSEFLDKYILLKHLDVNSFSFYLITITSILANVIQHFYYGKRIRCAEKENKRIGAEKTKLQELLTGKKLKSSDNPKRKKK